MRKEDLQDGRVNAMIGTALGMGFVSPHQMLWFATIFLMCVPFIFRNPLQGLLIFACIYGTFWILTGNDPSQFFERISKPKKYVAEQPMLTFNRAGIPMPAPMKRQKTTFKIKGKKEDYHHAERKFHLLTQGQIELEGKQVGFYLLRRGLQLMFIFGWYGYGHDPSVTAQQAFSIVSAAKDALNTLPKDIDIKCYEDVNCSCEDYLRMQAGLLGSKDHDPLSKALIRSRSKRGQDLTDQGRLLNNKIYIFAKYRVELGGDYALKQTWLDDLLSKTQPLISLFKGDNIETKKAWEKVIDYAYHYAYGTVNSLLGANTGFGMRIRTMTVEDLWERDYLELHDPPVPDIPQYIVYNEQGLQMPVINDPGNHSLGVLWESQKGYPAVPVFDRHYVYFPIKNKYAAFVRIGQIRSFPKDKEEVARGYLKYLWNILAGTNQPIYDSRVVTELTPDHSGFEMFQLDRIISNSVKREALAMKKQTVDVVAMRRREQAVEARDLLEENNIPYWCSLGIWLYRETLDQLNQDTSDLIQRIPTASVERVWHQLEEVWFQSWPFEWEAFLTKPNHRRQKYLGFQALPAMPLLKIKQADKQGMMLVSRELNTPIYIDIANRKNHTAIFAKTGVGKSIIMFEMILEYLLYGYLAVI
ncbi:MAG: DUF87 domain-containing protein [Cyanobacteria bacterium P01_G01_bin.49]